ncbi:CdaR family protein [Bizionia sediminis]|uniref:CdaR family protein n=1 Tax=Bizionia sediminis TaxID=1737064 RepID=A0ABW5KX08_9FLAO
MKLLKHVIHRALKNKRINVFVLFLALSFGVLLVMKLSNVYTNTISFKINKVNIPETAVILNDSSSKLQITLKAKGFSLLPYYFKKPEIAIDFSKHITKTKTHYIWNKHSAYLDIMKQFDKAVEVVNITPDTLQFPFDVNAIKKVPVKINQRIKYAIGYDVLGNLKATPDSIKIIGPEAVVTSITHVATDTLKQQGVKSDLDVPMTLLLPKTKHQIQFSDSQVRVAATVTKFTEGKLKIPVTIINVPDNLSLKYYPKKVSVYYYTSLEHYKTISASDFEVICNFNEVTKQQPFLVPKLVKQPEGLKHVKINQDHIEYLITK